MHRYARLVAFRTTAVLASVMDLPSPAAKGHEYVEAPVPVGGDRDAAFLVGRIHDEAGCLCDVGSLGRRSMNLATSQKPPRVPARYFSSKGYEKAA
jgi:hypothetical protein